ncbi:replication initiation protein [Enterococcus cecorum]|uniref:replication initiation protein n=1 Tax=Enterococcus cecorum TaxID=44008 RepID=UPI00148DFB0A|nr:replication initiation protein [Enterococcus cecorum]CAI3474479.1 replication initiation protein [Enterococcus cecorum]CAI3485113.1 replication initiation protein [Enterococcus cecorum]CAI3489130.1 replication initiation protein [Enterococcus cecorum]CAI3515769.1 replication initiation protein [Enterococcus cecorum]
MSNEIVKYHHELNTIPLRKFTPVEMNLFFSIISRMREKGDKTVRFTFEQLKDLSNYKATANTRFVDDLKSTYEKLLQLRFGRTSRTGLSVEMFVLFTEFNINGDIKEPYVDIRIYEKALPLLNNLDEWVRYSLQQFSELQSSYSKTMFRLLKQWRTVGKVYFEKEDLHELLGIPKSYKQGDIDRAVFSPIKQELTPIFKGLTITKNHARRRGNPVVGYTFTFKPEINKADDFNKHAPTKEEQRIALELANDQEYIDKREKFKTSGDIDDQITTLERKLEVLKQVKELYPTTKVKSFEEKEQKSNSEQTFLSEDEKDHLMGKLGNIFK